MTQPRILIVGAGAVGGFFGAKLLLAGRDVTFLVRQARAAQLARDGLVLHTASGDASTVAPTVTAAELASRRESGTGDDWDVVIVTVKAFGLAGALEDIAPAIGPRTLVLPVLNGMKHIDVLREHFGDEHVLGGLAMVSTTLNEDGSITQLFGGAGLTYGALTSGTIAPDDPRIVALHDALSDAGFRATLSRDIERDLWQKWIVLGSGGALTCLLRAPVGEIVAVRGGKQTALAIVAEFAALATAAGITPDEARLSSIRETLTEAGSGFTTSMYRDLARGNPVEADQILGDAVERANHLGVAVPLLTAAYVSLAVYQASRDS